MAEASGVRKFVLGWLNDQVGSTITNATITGLLALGSTFVMPAYQSFLSEYSSFLPVVIIADVVVLLLLTVTQLKKRRAHKVWDRLLYLTGGVTLVAFLFSYFYCEAYTFDYEGRAKVMSGVLTIKASEFAVANNVADKPAALFRHFHSSEAVWEGVRQIKVFIQLQIVLVVVLFTSFTFFVIKVAAYKLAAKGRSTKPETPQVNEQTA